MTERDGPGGPGHCWRQERGADAAGRAWRGRRSLPRWGSHLTGFAGRRGSTAVHDELTATAPRPGGSSRGLVGAPGPGSQSKAALRPGSGPGHHPGSGQGRRERWRAAGVALVALDLLGMYGDQIGPTIKRQVARVSGIPPERCCCAAATPTTDGGGRGVGGGRHPAGAGLPGYTPHQVAGAVGAAAGGLRPVTLAVGRGQVRVGVNRRERRPDGPDRAGPEPQAPRSGGPGVAPGPAAHPGAAGGRAERAGRGARPRPRASPVPAPRVGREPLAVVGRPRPATRSRWGAGYVHLGRLPGRHREGGARLVGGKAPTLQGACGDIDPVAKRPDWDYSRRLVRPSRAGRPRRLPAQPVSGTPLRLTRETVACRPSCPPHEGAREQVADPWRRRRSACEVRERGRGSGGWNRRGLERARRGAGGPGGGGERCLPSRAPLARCAWATAAAGHQPQRALLRDRDGDQGGSPFPWTAVAGYTDAAEWYVPTRGAYAEGGYEVDRACPRGAPGGEVI